MSYYIDREHMLNDLAVYLHKYICEPAIIGDDRLRHLAYKTRTAVEISDDDDMEIIRRVGRLRQMQRRTTIPGEPVVCRG